jgi:hypothetical protein
MNSSASDTSIETSSRQRHIQDLSECPGTNSSFGPQKETAGFDKSDAYGPIYLRRWTHINTRFFLVGKSD